MLDSLLFSLNALLPIILLVLLGYGLKQNGTIGDKFLSEGNKFCFNYCFLAMMFINIYKIDSFDSIRWQTVIVAIAGVVILFLAGLAYVLLFVPENRQKGVVHQAFYRSNFAIIGLPLAQNLFDDEGMAAAALVSAFAVPLFNVFAVVSLTVFVQKNEDRTDRSSKLKNFFKVILQILKNPLIEGVALGLICLAIRPYTGGWRLSTGNLKFLYKAMDSLATIAPWLSLVILGGRFSFSAIRGLRKQITQGVCARLFGAPLVGFLTAYFLPGLLGLPALEGADWAALFALYAAPIAIASVAMADQMDNDSDLAGQILVWSTLFSVITLFVYITAMRAAGFF